MFYIDSEDTELMRVDDKTVDFDRALTHVDMIICQNPYCKCANVDLVFLTAEQHKNDSEGILVGIDLINRQLDGVVDTAYKIQEEHREKVAEISTILEKNLTEEDWTLLVSVMLEKKEELIADMPPSTDNYMYNFTTEHIIDSSLMVCYLEIYPLSHVFEVSKDGVDYKIVDRYCKNPECDCKQIDIQLFKTGEVEMKMNFGYDYEKDKTDNKKYNWVIRQLKENYPEWQLTITLRALRVRQLYLEHILRLLELRNSKLAAVDISPAQKTIAQKRKIGRNETCPCGSGKKYKRCCMKKTA